MNDKTMLYSETLEELDQVKRDIAGEYRSLAEFCAHLRTVEDRMRRSGVVFHLDTLSDRTPALA